MFNFLLVENNHLFMMLKYFLSVPKINYLVLKIFFKNSYKHRQVRSYFEDLVIKKIIVQTKFNLDARFNTYDVFMFWICMHVGDIIIVVLFCMHRISLLFRWNHQAAVHLKIVL
jgi:hypothetical protein